MVQYNLKSTEWWYFVGSGGRTSRTSVLPGTSVSIICSGWFFSTWMISLFPSLNPLDIFLTAFYISISSRYLNVTKLQLSLLWDLYSAHDQIWSFFMYNLGYIFILQFQYHWINSLLAPGLKCLYRSLYVFYVGGKKLSPLKHCSEKSIKFVSLCLL